MENILLLSVPGIKGSSVMKRFENAIALTSYYISADYNVSSIDGGLNTGEATIMNTPLTVTMQLNESLPELFQSLFKKKVHPLIELIQLKESNEDFLFKLTLKNALISNINLSQYNTEESNVASVSIVYSSLEAYFGKKRIAEVGR